MPLRPQLAEVVHLEDTPGPGDQQLLAEARHNQQQQSGSAPPGLSLEEMHIFCSAPAGADDPAVLSALLDFARSYAAGRPVMPADIVPPPGAPPPGTPPATPAAMAAAEAHVRMHELYLWLAGRLGGAAFRGAGKVRAARLVLAQAINTALRSMGGVMPL